MTQQFNMSNAERPMECRRCLAIRHWLFVIVESLDSLNRLLPVVPMNTGIPTWILLALCLCASFLLSGMEAGVFALSRLHVRRLARAGKPSAKLLHGFLEKPENFLWTILVGNTLANFLILGWTLLEAARVAFGRPRLDRRRFCRRRFSVLRAVRFAAQNVFPRASEPVVPGGGARVPPRAYRVKPARLRLWKAFPELRCA